MMCLADEDAVIHAHNTFALTQNHFKMLGILFALLSRDTCELRWLNLIQTDQLTFSFRDDFLRYNQYIALFNLKVLCV